jgi:biotin operon repressor
MATEEIGYGLRMAHAYIDLTRVLHEILLPDTAGHFGAENETLLVLLAVFVGDAENRPMSAPKIADYIGLPRASVYRRVRYLTDQGRIERVGSTYRLAPETMRGDRAGRIRKVMTQFVAG